MESIYPDSASKATSRTLVDTGGPVVNREGCRAPGERLSSKLQIYTSLLLVTVSLRRPLVESGNLTDQVLRAGGKALVLSEIAEKCIDVPTV